MEQKLRYEYRIFCDDPFPFTKGINHDFSKLEEKSSSETYLLFANHRELNLKIREERLDIKRLAETKRGFEKWQPLHVEEFVDVFRTLGLHASPTNPELLIQECAKRDDAAALSVFKSRTLYANGDVLTEITTGEIEGEPFTSVAAECSDLEQLEEIVQILKLGKYPNSSYITKLHELAGF